MSGTAEEKASGAGSLARGAAVLGAAAVISKLLGTLQKVPLQNVAGDGVFGIYNLVYPFYILILYIATAGFPVAVSAFVAEKMAGGQESEARRVLRLAAAILTVTGIVFFAMLYFGAPHIAAAIGAPSTIPAIRSVSFALLFVPLMSALRGFFQGMQNMAPTAWSQVVEQLIRVAAMVALLIYLTRGGYPDEWIAAGATFGSAAGAAGGLLYMLRCWRVYRRETGSPGGTGAANAEREPGGALARRFLLYALPICLGSIVLPMLTMADTFTMPWLLQAGGLDETGALRAFGLYNHGLPLVQLVTMIASSMAAALVPAIAGAKLRGQPAEIRAKTELALRLSWWIALAASLGLAVTAEPLNVMFYGSSEGTAAMTILAFTAVFGTLNAVSAGILQGLGAAALPARNMLIAAFVKVAGNLLLMPAAGINGAAAAAVAAFAAAGLLNMRAIRRLTGAGFPLRATLVRPLAAAACMCAGIALLRLAAEPALGRMAAGSAAFRLANSGLALGSVAGGAALYGFALVRFRAVTREDLERIPGLGRRLPPRLIRWCRVRS